MKERLVVLGLGSNIGDKAIYLSNAIEKLTTFFGSQPDLSSVYETAPVGFQSDSTFLNQCVSYYSDLAASTILKEVLAIEKELGRKRPQISNEGYSSRTIDIDILFVGSEIHQQADLVIPHPRLHERKFVLIPLSEIVPEFIHPTMQISVLKLLNASKDDGFVEKNQG